MWLCCHGDSEYRLDDQWLRGKCVSTKQLVALHEQPLAGLIPIPPKYKALLLNLQAGYIKCFSLSWALNSCVIVFLAGAGAKILLTTEYLI